MCRRGDNSRGVTLHIGSTTWFSRGVSSYVRYFADQPIVLKAINNGLAGADPQFKIDGGEILRGKEHEDSKS